MHDEITALSPNRFPPLLKEIPDAPKKLYVRGTLPSYDSMWLAVVGSRAATNYGRQAVRHLIEGLRGYPVVIVSGLAYGIDAEAHKAALEAGLPIVAVPGSGLDWSVLYPRANVNLAREIIKAGGAHLSEFEPNMKAADYTFPQRNRIMAGLCKAVLVIEAKERSGSLITARLATEYNRELLVVPGSIFSAESQDILRALGIETQTREMTLHIDLFENERRVLEIIVSPVSRDKLLETLKLPVSEANILLSTMEIKGLIVEELGVVRIK
ncbi:MAG: protecting protein DprA protein [Candidatus Kaiserbacteria bacterium GW2011_GWC2_49_12]|uniref:Protecting protein DprA protein n=1 Tax=Candidatus Kaiserbacteria bacterium GW2011_GWC2_49_12 TaxID=1618675 RepID=A0A0G1VJ83_9BACT|nr:MAG: protecting protein DprA protein [Candidatus Kaiserbacteria bacterium GW2011_GWC2_49_12]